MTREPQRPAAAAVPVAVISRPGADYPALALANVNPRVGRSGSLAFAFFAFVLYFNLLLLGEGWIAGGRFNFPAFMLALHGGALALSLLWLAKRHNNWTLASMLRRTHAPTKAAP